MIKRVANRKFHMSSASRSGGTVRPPSSSGISRSAACSGRGNCLRPSRPPPTSLAYWEEPMGITYQLSIRLPIIANKNVQNDDESMYTIVSTCIVQTCSSRSMCLRVISNYQKLMTKKGHGKRVVCVSSRKDFARHGETANNRTTTGLGLRGLR